MSELTNRKIVIIGGTSGIGLAAAQQLASRGASVTVTGRDRERAGKVRQQNARLAVEIVDGAARDALAAFYQSHGTIDDLVVCASGGKGAGPFAQLSRTELHDGFEQKFFVHFNAVQAALPFLRTDGSLTFVSAISARAALPGTAGLAAINGAIEALVKPLARELKPLRVNAISPGVVETPWWDNLPRDVRETLLKQTSAASLVGRNGSPQDLGEAIVFVLSNGFISGTVLEIDGGLHLS
jgi:NAD(P)-dependent dehydrogenase (short-subunit alcohol dehydrogenase family)